MCSLCFVIGEEYTTVSIVASQECLCIYDIVYTIYISGLIYIHVCNYYYNIIIIIY